MTNHPENRAYVNRLRAVDLLRGLAIVIMALDHSRGFFGYTPFNPTDLSQTSALLFLTRWITHLAAPTFFFLAGVSAFLYGRKHTLREQCIFLLTRGLWLIFLEVTLISYSWDLSGSHFINLQVVWALGVSMICLSALIWLPAPAILAFSLILIFGHNSLDSFSFHSPLLNHIWTFLHVQSNYQIGHWVVDSFYPLLPWIAVMSLGYCFGPWFTLPTQTKSKRFSYLGCACLLLFIVLRYFNIYGDQPWSPQDRGLVYSFLAFIKVSKYPPSLQYLLVTLGLSFLVLPWLENWKGRLSEFILCFGKVPLFFYILHLYLLSIAATLYSRFIFHSASGWWRHNGITPVPSTYHFHLSYVYPIWLLLLIGSYPLCRWYQHYKSIHAYRWLSYL